MKYNFIITYYFGNAKITKYVIEERYVKPILKTILRQNIYENVMVEDKLNNKWKAENYLSQES